MALYKNILETIGRTPLIRLNKIGANLKAELYVKVEAFNPGGSTKDRIAVKMIEEAEKRGVLKPGGTIVEATAGNTGVGLALVAAIKGYRCVFVLPDKMSEDKISLLKAFGAEVIITKTNVSPESPESYNSVANRLAKEIPNSFRPDQFSNTANPLAHYLSTGPEIWEDLKGEVDVFVGGMGTCGTVSGTAKYLKQMNPQIVVIGADPEGSILSGDTPKPWKVEGIGEDFIPANLNRQVIDEFIRVSDKESFNMARRLAKEEGIFAGGSSGTALAAAIKYAKRLTEVKKIVVFLPDTGRNYVTKIYSDKWMNENRFLDFYEEAIPLKVVLKDKTLSPDLISVTSEDRISTVVSLMHHHNFSQIPVVDDGKLVGSIYEATLMKLLYDGIDLLNQEVKSVMADPMPCLDEETDASEAYRLLMSGRNGLMVLSQGKPVALVTRIDLVNFLMNKKGVVQ
jgi:cystathionine beta-synthase